MPAKGSREAEEIRLRGVYRARPDQNADRRYDPLGAAGRWNLLESERLLLAALGDLFVDRGALVGARILEVGCGRGGHLIRLAALGVPPDRLAGIDLIPERIEDARRLHPGIEFVEGNAATLPWSSGTFDLVLQLVCLSSVLDPEVRASIAAEMRRVLRPGGAILSFDFVRNPVNRDTVGIPRRELERLFPSCRIQASRVLLAPPLARQLASISWPLATILARIPWLCLHLMAIIRPPASTVE